jgi:hypothetical protein
MGLIIACMHIKEINAIVSKRRLCRQGQFLQSCSSVDEKLAEFSMQTDRMALQRSIDILFYGCRQKGRNMISDVGVGWEAVVNRVCGLSFIAALIFPSDLVHTMKGIVSMPFISRFTSSKQFKVFVSPFLHLRNENKNTHL